MFTLRFGVRAPATGAPGAQCAGNFGMSLLYRPPINHSDT
jgi:hypothetical protein